MKYDTASPYLAAYVIFRDKNKLACLLREHTGWSDGLYGWPSGKVEKQETAIDGALREAKEEVGVDIDPADLQYLLTVHRNTGDGTDWIDIIFEARAWTGDLVNAEPHKHSELAWLDMSDPITRPKIIPPLLDYIDAIEKGTGFIQYGWNW
jgi:8-oxo-dGTP diphosphatase